MNESPLLINLQNDKVMWFDMFYMTVGHNDLILSKGGDWLTEKYIFFMSKEKVVVS